MNNTKDIYAICYAIPLSCVVRLQTSMNHQNLSFFNENHKTKTFVPLMSRYSFCLIYYNAQFHVNHPFIVLFAFNFTTRADNCQSAAG